MTMNNMIRERYRLESVLGQGSQGTSYRAFDTQTQQTVVVKMLHFSRLNKWKSVELFEREAAILQELSHPQIPSYIDFFSLENTDALHYVLVQDHIEGKSLQQLVDEGWRGTETEIADIIRQVVDILEYLHSLTPPVLHRDVSPKNILLSDEKQVFLVDFGAVQDRLRTTFLGSSTLSGTFGYMPFEQFSGQTVPASDYYALGATLLYLLTHRHPSEFQTDGMTLNFQPYIQASHDMIHLLNGLLESAPEHRLASPRDIRNVLQNISQNSCLQSRISPQPHGSKVQKTEPAEGELVFVIPGKIKDSGVGFCTAWLLFVALFTFAGSTTDEWFPLFWSIPFWVAGFGFGIPACYKAFGRTTLELTPQSVHANYSLLGLTYPLTFPTSTLKRTAASNQEPKSVTFQSGTQSLKLGSHLTEAEQEWLSQEIDCYLAMYAKPEEMASRQPHGTKIKKQVYRQDRIHYRLPLKFQKEPFIGLGFMIFWLGFLIFMLLDTGEFVWFSLIFWIVGVLTTLGSLAGIVRMLSRTTLDLTPDTVKARSAFLGLGFSHQVPMTANTKVELVESPQHHPDEEPNRKITIYTDAEKLNFGLRLDRSEQEWLVQEVQRYILKCGDNAPEGIN